MGINIGITESNRKEIARELSLVLINYYTLYLTTQHYHWNVTGPSFYTLHALFEKQYKDLANAIDQIAERIRALGPKVVVDFSQFQKLHSMQENLKDEDMIKNLLIMHEASIQVIRCVFPVAKKGKDESTLDFLTHRLQVHEKTAWVLRSLLKQ